MDKQTNEILIELKNKILQKYNLKEMRLFGSRVRGESDAHSDIDIFVRISDVSKTTEEDIFDLAYETELKHGCLIDIFVFDDKALSGIHFRPPVYQKIMQEGLII
ncbi:Nucleotidyltransferase domain-containing protein [Desulfonema limicola]|uniref:Nucleotidyltransferase domain-containing protein n=1 Tax=Desulfonema limicola TaxID=45656 RepID=A0A975GJC2_9BACT|nr:nucleotidyltransferase domain-containing protein [Desulfonema limicola]QTA83295.1 Nucleotidyltransferase domain-containing protein [Desulfonema limicola]